MNKKHAFPALLLVAALVWAGFSWAPADDPEPEPAVTEATTEAVTWNLDPFHSEATFFVRYLGLSRVTGVFHDFDVELTADPDDLSSLETTATVQVGSIDTRVEDRDDHLRSPDFFDAESFPEMTFVSSEVRDIDGSSFTLVGDLTIKDVTREVEFDAELLGTAVGMQGNERAAFTATTVIDRMDYGVSWNELTDAGGIIVGHDVTITLDLQMLKAEE